MRRITTATLILVMVGLMLLAVLPSERYVVLDGGFWEAEYRLRLINAKGEGIQGAELTVENHNGERAFCYPVSDYAPDHIPKSNEDGTIVFHHVVSAPIEFSERYGYRYFVFPINKNKPLAPLFICRLLWRDAEVFQTPYNDLNSELVTKITANTKGNDIEKHEVRWRWPTDWPRGFPEHLKPRDEAEKTIAFPVLNRTIRIEDTSKEGRKTE